MVCHGIAWCGMVRYGIAWYNMAWQDMIWHGMALVWHGMVGHWISLHNGCRSTGQLTSPGSCRGVISLHTPPIHHPMVTMVLLFRRVHRYQECAVRDFLGIIWFFVESNRDYLGIACCGMVWYDVVWHGMVWHGMVWHCMAWYGMA